MSEVLQRKLETLVENRNIISKGFKFEYDSLSVAAALLCTNAGVTPDVEKMKECKKILKEKTGTFSGFQGMVELILITKMSISLDPELYLDDVLRVYDIIKTSKFIDYYEVIMAAANVVDMGRINDIEALAAKYKEIVNRMKKEHPVLTGKEDAPFAMLLAMTDKDVDSIISEMEECYSYMRKNFKAGFDATQGISEVFTLYDTDVKTKCDRAIEIYKLLKERGIKYGKDQEFASLGVLADTPVDVNVLVDDIAEGSDYLKKKEGFGNFLLGKDERFMFAAMLSAGLYDEGVNSLSGTMTSTIALVVAQEIQMAMISASINASVY